MNTKLSKILLAGAVVAFGFSMRAMANSVPLSPGNTVAPALATTNPGYTVVATQTGTFASATLNGDVLAYVLSNYTDNPWSSAGGLTFVYMVQNSSGSTDSITGIGIDGWSGFSTNVADLIAGSSQPIQPYSATRGVNGDTVTFGWLNPPVGFGLITPGSNGYEVLIYTDATSWTNVSAGVRDGTGVSLVTLGPAIPDGGTTALLLGFGLLGMSLAVRRFKKA